MSLNIDNLFVRADVEHAISAFESASTASKWKIAVSDVGGGWTQMVESHETTPPQLAQAMSSSLRTSVVCAQVYETSGDAALQVFENGDLAQRWSDESCEDLIAEVQSRIESQGINAELVRFPETIRRTGWLTRTRR